MFKFKIGDKVKSKKIISFDNLNIINENIAGIVVDVDNTAKTTQPYMVQFEETNYPKYGRKWWVYENEIEIIN